MRLGFAIAAHLDADVLLLDEVFAVGDEAFQRKCFGKVFEFKQRGGTIVFVSHDASQVERLCERAVLLREGRLVFDGPTHEAIVRYRKALAADADPAERAAGLREWGTGEATIAAARLVGSKARSGSSSSRASRSRCGSGSRPRTGSRHRSSSSSSATTAACSSPRTCSTPAASAGRPARASCATTSIACRSRTAASTSGSGSPTAAASCLHWLDDALVFLVYPAGEERGGVVRLEGSWTAEENSETR